MFLKFVYDDAQKLPQGQRQSLHSGTISEALGFTADEQHRIEQYLKDKHFIEFVSFGPYIEITAHGIDYVEDALSHPDRKTEFFPAITVMNISGGVHHSQIQQGTNRSQQTIFAGLDPASLRELVATIRAQSAALTIAEGRRLELDSDLATIDAQLQSPTPKKGIIRRMGNSPIQRLCFP
jgi:hypothetical protein